MKNEFNLKKAVGIKAAEWVQDGMIIGMGTGSTAHYFILELARKIREESLSIKTVASSSSTTQLARDNGIPLIDMQNCTEIDLYVDGADEIDPLKNLIKGRGAAMVQEKILAASAKKFLVIADESKLVQALCTNHPVPVEILPMAKSTATKSLLELGGTPKLRIDSDGKNLAITDQGNLILDTYFKIGPDAVALDKAINQIPGVLGHGLFIQMANEIITTNSGKVIIIS